MKLYSDTIASVASWKDNAPPMGKSKQWKEGRSAMELANYMTSVYPAMPREAEDILLNFTDRFAEFELKAEYVTSLPGKGNGRNHDAFLFHPDIYVGIEGKADEAFGNDTVGTALDGASENKKFRIVSLIKDLFGDTPDMHMNIRYQLITAAAGTLYEAKENTNKALLLIITFLGKSCDKENIERNNSDLKAFLKDIGATEEKGCYYLPTRYGKENGIDLYLKKLEITL